jgi:HEAT repeat protein
MQQQSWGQLISNLRNNEGDIRHADEAREAISRIADESHVADLYALLQDTDFVIREAAAIPLARLEGVKALPALFLALTRGFQEGCDNDGLSSTVTDLLEAHKSTAAPILLEMLSAADSETRDNAAWALGFISSEITATPLLAALSDVATSVRSSAAGSLASFKNDPRVPEALLKSLLDGDEQVRISAASALGDIGDQRAIGPLKTMLKRCDRKSRPIVEHALEQLGDPVSD